MAASRTQAPVGTLAVGRIGRAHGVRGEVHVVPYWRESVTLAGAGRIWLDTDAGATLHTVQSARRVPKGFLVKLEGVDDREGASSLTGARVSVSRAELPALDPGEYYLADLIGAEVRLPEGSLGEVIEVTAHPSVDAIVVRCPDGRVVEQPLTAPWLKSVDVAARLVELHSSDGLI